MADQRNSAGLSGCPGGINSEDEGKVRNTGASVRARLLNKARRVSGDSGEGTVAFVATVAGAAKTHQEMTY